MRVRDYYESTENISPFRVSSWSASYRTVIII